MELVNAHGVDVAYDRTGSGPPIVFVHGAGDDARVWGPQLEALSDAFTVVAWDEPGAGRSSDIPAGFGLTEYADCLAAVIEDVGLGSAHVAGLSWGGTVVLELYRRRPDLVAALILADTYAGWSGSLPAGEVSSRRAGARAALSDPGAGLDAAFPGLFAGDPPSRFVPLLEAMWAAARKETLRQVLDTLAAADLSAVLPEIAVPTLLVWGEEDARSPLRIARQFEAAITRATLVVIPDCGHLSNLERPDEFNAAVRGFCAG